MVRASFAEIGKEQDLDPELHTAFGATAARANYLSSDRPDIQFAVKEAPGFMSEPSQRDWGLLKRIGRYLITCLRVVQWFEWRKLCYFVNACIDVELPLDIIIDF